MTAPVQPVPQGPTLEGHLAQLANAAIQKGADPKAVTDRLGVMVQHLRDNPDVAEKGEAAIAKGADPTAVAGRVWSLASAAKADQSARTLSDGSEAGRGFLPAAFDAASFGLSRKVDAAVPALKAVAGTMLRHPFTDVSGTAEPIYRQNLAAEDAAASQYAGQHPVANATAQLAGGLVPIALTGGLSAAPEAANASRLARWGKVIASGTKYGAVNAAARSDAVDEGRGVTGMATDVAKGAGLGAAFGAASIPVSGAIGWSVARTPLPAMIASGTKQLARVLPGRAGQAVGEVADAVSPHVGQAQGIIARAAAADDAAGIPVPVTHPSLPPMALNTAGPNVEGLAEKIATTPGTGRATILNAVEQRKQAMLPAIRGELEKGTGVSADAGLQPLQDALDARAAEAKQLYGAAREATKGQAVVSPTFEQIKQTPAGQAALKFAMGKQGNMFRELPQQIEPPPGFDPEQWQQALTHMKERGILPPVTEGSEALPDPETLHLMGERITKMAKLNDPTNPLSSEAVALLPLIDKVKGELPDVWKQADAAYAARSRIIDMQDRGRNIFRTPSNPAAKGKAAVLRSLDGVDAAVEKAAPDEAAALQQGAGMAAQAKLADQGSGSVKSPGRIFKNSPTAQRQLAHAFTSPESAGDFQQAVDAWDRIAAQNERLTGNSRTGLRQNLSSGSDFVPPGSLISQPRRLLRSVINKLNDEYKAGVQKQVDAEIARIMTSPDMQAIPKAARAGELRLRLMHSLNLGVGASAALAGTR